MHTPGPWQVVERYSNGCETCPEIYAGAQWVATVVGAPYLGHESTNENARLIAAAPDLLEALRRFVDHFSKDGMLSRTEEAMLRGAKSIISQAEGLS